MTFSLDTNSRIRVLVGRCFVTRAYAQVKLIALFRIYTRFTSDFNRIDDFELVMWSSDIKLAYILG